MGPKNLSNRSIGGDSIAMEKHLREVQKMNRAIGVTVPNFADEARANQVIPIKLTNSGADAKIIAIFQGELLNVTEILNIAGVAVDAIATEGVTIADAVSCTTKAGTSIDYLQRFVKRNATRVLRFQVSASAEEQLDESLVFAHINPFAKAGQQVLTPSAYKKESNLNSKLVTISPKDIQLDDQTVMYVNLLPGATLTISMTIGASSNAASNLAKQAELAYNY